nr:MAG TPA: GRIP-related Arf-binding domain [Caudoviricetes sp.]
MDKRCISSFLLSFGPPETLEKALEKSSAFLFLMRN